jgi:hypothetical protein
MTLRIVRHGLYHDTVDSFGTQSAASSVIPIQYRRIDSPTARAVSARAVTKRLWGCVHPNDVNSVPVDFVGDCDTYPLPSLAIGTTDSTGGSSLGAL